MRRRALNFLGCPFCQSRLELHAFEQLDIAVPAELRGRLPEGVPLDHFTQEIKEGLLLCDDCKCMFPITSHLARVFRYTTSASAPFISRFKAQIAPFERKGFRWPKAEPEPGELLTKASFGREWGEYAYDGMVWNLDYHERLALCLRELGVPPDQLAGKTFVDIGCGMGVLTNAMSTEMKVEAVGLDLSEAAGQAAREFLRNPLVHFVQGSIFHPPFARGRFDMAYSSGVLHHTYDTRTAFFSAAQLVRPGGRFYVWLYSAERSGAQGVISKSINFVRKACVARLPGPVQNVAVYILTLVFWGTRALLRTKLYGDQTVPYSFRQALHATRDAFTPRYAHHHTRAEVTAWFKEAGFANVEALTGERSSHVKTIPVSVRGDFSGPTSAGSLKASTGASTAR